MGNFHEKKYSTAVYQAIFSNFFQASLVFIQTLIFAKDLPKAFQSISKNHYVKSVRIRSFLFHIFPHSEWIRRDSGKIGIRKIQNTNTFHAVHFLFLKKLLSKCRLAFLRYFSHLIKNQEESTSHTIWRNNICIVSVLTKILKVHSTWDK